MAERYYEVFTSRTYDNKAMAEWKLEKVREEHKNWVEESAYVEELPNGQYRAVRKHYLQKIS